MTRRGVPAIAILASSVVGFLCVIAAAVSPDTVFVFLLNSSGAVILFVYLLIAVSQIVLRYRTPDSELRVKMWLFPVLSIITAAAIVGILVQMYLQDDVRSQLMLSLLSWAVVIVLFLANKWFVGRRPVVEGVAATTRPHRVLVLANQTVQSKEMLDELRRIDADRDATYFVVVPASPIETGTAATHGPLDVAEATRESHNSGWTTHWRHFARRTSKPTASWATTGRCGRWPPPSTRSVRIRSSSRHCHPKSRCGTASTSWTAHAPSTACR